MNMAKAIHIPTKPLDFKSRNSTPIVIAATNTIEYAEYKKSDAPKLTPSRTNATEFIGCTCPAMANPSASSEDLEYEHIRELTALTPINPKRGFARTVRNTVWRMPRMHPIIKAVDAEGIRSFPRLTLLSISLLLLTVSDSFASRSDKAEEPFVSLLVKEPFSIISSSESFAGSSSATFSSL
nr:hypothetical protein Iba_chr12cCG3800 [Ipomoea batatas]